MNASAQTILAYVLLYKYWALFAITFIAAVVLPIPPGTLLMASSALANHGYLSFPLILIVASSGNILGDNLGYWLSRLYGKPILYRIGFKKVIESQRYKAIEKRLVKEPGWIIFISRFEVFSNLAVNILSGIGQVPYGRYLLFEATGEILQVVIYCSIGYFFGDAWQSINAAINKSFSIIVLIAVVLGFIFWKKVKKKFNIA
jgi:membrane protein DedA with SNARE-associated domain